MLLGFQELYSRESLRPLLKVQLLVSHFQSPTKFKGAKGIRDEQPKICQVIQYSRWAPIMIDCYKWNYKL